MPPSFVADVRHPGTTERAWLSASRLRELPPLPMPDVDRVVVVAPHPDDEILGPGGLVHLLHAAGIPIEICAVTDGEAYRGDLDTAASAEARRARSAESLDALARLGIVDVRDRHRLQLPDSGVRHRERELSSYLCGRLGPRTLCVAPWRLDGHPDHDASGRAAASASQRRGSLLLEYLVWAWHWADPNGDDLPWDRCRRLNLSRRVAATKRWSSAAFVSQTRPGPDGREPVLPPVILRRFWRPFEVFVS